MKLFVLFYKALTLPFSSCLRIANISGHYIRESVTRKLRIYLTPIPKPNGIGIVQLPFGYQIVSVATDKMTPDNAMQLLKAVMYSQDNESRRSYDFLPYFTGIPDFLSTESTTMRKKHIMPYLHTMLSQVDYLSEMNRLLNLLRENNQSQYPLFIRNIISDHLQSLFTRSLLGVDFPKEIKSIIHNIEESSHHALIFGLLPSWAIKLLLLAPSIRNRRKDYNTVIRNFLIEQIERLKITEENEEESKKNWFAKIVRQKAPNISRISKEEIDLLVDDPELRLPIALLLGTNNLTRVIQSLLTTLFDNEFELLFGNQSRVLAKNNIIANLLLETSQCELRNADLLDKEKRPFLHATYLEALRTGNDGFSIARMLQNKIVVNDIEIPSHSFVTFNLGDIFIENTSCPTNAFAPKRFINEEGQLSADSELHQGRFTPFGIGPRKCPAFRLSELVVKQYLVTVLKAVNRFNGTKSEFYDTEQNTADTFARRHFVKYAFFKSIKSEENAKINESLEIADKVAGIVTGYCL